MAKLELPESHKNYQEAAQWMLTIILGGLAGLLGLAGFTDRLIGGGEPIKVFFAVLGLCIAVTIISCVFSIVHIIAWGNDMEMEAEILSTLGQGKPEADLDDAKKNELSEARNKRTTSRGKTRFWFFILFIAFCGSLIGFIGVGAWLLSSKPEKNESAKYEIYVFPAADGNQLQPFPFVRLNKNTGELYRLSETSNVWIRIGGTNKIEPNAGDFSQMRDHRTNELSGQLRGFQGELEAINSKLLAQLLIATTVLETNLPDITEKLQQIETAVTNLTKALTTNPPVQNIDFAPVTNELAKIQREIDRLTTAVETARAQSTQPASNSPHLFLRNTGFFFHIGRSQLGTN